MRIMALLRRLAAPALGAALLAGCMVMSSTSASNGGDWPGYGGPGEDRKSTRLNSSH